MKKQHEISEIEAQVKKLIEELKVNFYCQSTKKDIKIAKVHFIGYQDDRTCSDNLYSFTGKGDFFVSDEQGNQTTLSEDMFDVDVRINNDEIIIDRVSLKTPH